MWAPTARSVMPLRAADPPERATGLPRLAPSMANWTVPVIVPSTVEVTVAVMSTPCPKTEGLGADCRPVVVGAGLTCWPPLRVPVAELKWASPL